MSSGQQSQAREPVTGICIDGSSVSAASVSIKEDGSPLVHAVRMIEVPELLEKVTRWDHPIFMDIDSLEFPNPDLLRSKLEEILGDEEFDHPTVGVFPADLVREWREDPSSTANTWEMRLALALRTCQSPNPHSYPRLFEFEGADGELPRTLLNLWSSRFDDVTSLAEQHYLRDQFQGLVNGNIALSQIFRIISSHSPEPLTLVDVGKLRTLYVGGREGRVLFCHAIPVGLVRDGRHYFQSIPPVLEMLEELDDRIGSLLLPPDATPSAAMQLQVSTPQLDCTRFATQISRYIYRVREIWDRHLDPGKVIFFLSGRSSRLPALRDHMQRRLSTRLYRFDRRPIPGLELAPGVKWPEVADHLLPIGAALAFHHRQESQFGLVLRSRRPSRLEAGRCSPDRLEDHRLYVIEAPTMAG